MSALALLLDRVSEHLRRYVVLSEHQRDALALWVAHTHAIEAAQSTPYVAISSAEKESGKTLLLEVLRPVVARPWFTGRVSPAALARKIDAETPTLLLDESDAAFGGDREYAEVLRGVLNSGYRRGGAYTVCVGQGAKIAARDFATFGPKAIAGLGKLPDTVASRSIPIRLKRRAQSEEIERHRERDVLPSAQLLFENLVTWADHAPLIEQLAEARPEIPDLSDRAADVWEPLLAIADQAGAEWGERARSSAVALSGAGEPDEDTVGVRLLSDCRAAFDARGDRLATRDLLAHLHALDEAPWGDWYGKPLSPRKLAELLRHYEIRRRVVRIDSGTAKGYRREDFDDAWGRYLPPSIGNSGDNGSGMPESALSQPVTGPSELPAENGHKPHEQADVTRVTPNGLGARDG